MNAIINTVAATDRTRNVLLNASVEVALIIITSKEYFAKSKILISILLTSITKRS
jgi:hypothetical protein